MEKYFDNQKHADALLEIEHLICGVLMLCDGMNSFVTCSTDDRQYKNATAGAFRLMSYTLDKVWESINEAEYKFRKSHGLAVRESKN